MPGRAHAILCNICYVCYETGLDLGFVTDSPGRWPVAPVAHFAGTLGAVGTAAL